MTAGIPWYALDAGATHGEGVVGAGGPPAWAGEAGMERKLAEHAPAAPAEVLILTQREDLHTAEFAFLITSYGTRMPKHTDISSERPELYRSRSHSVVVSLWMQSR